MADLLHQRSGAISVRCNLVVKSWWVLTVTVWALFSIATTFRDNFLGQPWRLRLEPLDYRSAVAVASEGGADDRIARLEDALVSLLATRAHPATLLRGGRRGAPLAQPQVARKGSRFPAWALSRPKWCWALAADRIDSLADPCRVGGVPVTWSA